MEDRIAAYLAHRMADAFDVCVMDLARIHGGSSQETFRLRASWRTGEGQVEHPLILRRAPQAGLVDIESDLEFNVYAALASSGFPVPRAWWLELDPLWLDRPFFIMGLMPGKPGQFHGAGDPYDGVGEAVARNFWRHLGALAQLPADLAGLGGLRGAGERKGFASRELACWEARLDAGEAIVEPIVRGAIRWLRANMPPEPAKPAICHGDYRSGNFLFLPDGTISAVLDWEMCHVSDPLEDIAWAINPMWTMERSLPLDEGLAIWEEASGLAIDRQALDWWRLFSAVKACALWTAAEASFAERTNREMIVALTAMRASHFHRGEILDRMRAMGAMG